MLCEQCREKDATVHVTLVAWPLAEPASHDFCESCYTEAEAARARSYASQPSAPLPVNVEQITASEYLEASARGVANSADSPALKHIHRELKRLPATRERLALKILTMAAQSLDRGDDHYDLIGLGGCFGRSIRSQRLPEYTALLEKIVFRSFELLSQFPNPPSEHPFAFGLSLAVLALRHADQHRFTTVLETLKGQCAEGAQENRRRILADLERSIVEADQDVRRRRGGTK
jgi:hypothetical protein